LSQYVGEDPLTEEKIKKLRKNAPLNSQNMEKIKQIIIDHNKLLGNNEIDNFIDNLKEKNYDLNDQSDELTNLLKQLNDKFGQQVEIQDWETTNEDPALLKLAKAYCFSKFETKENKEISYDAFILSLNSSTIIHSEVQPEKKKIYHNYEFGSENIRWRFVREDFVNLVEPDAKLFSQRLLQLCEQIHSKISGNIDTAVHGFNTLLYNEGEKQEVIQELTTIRYKNSNDKFFIDIWWIMLKGISAERRIVYKNNSNIYMEVEYKYSQLSLSLEALKENRIKILDNIRDKIREKKL